MHKLSSDHSQDQLQERRENTTVIKEDNLQEETEEQLLKRIILDQMPPMALPH
jgi:hypothetical protein